MTQNLWSWVLAHWVSIAYALGAWALIASLLNKIPTLQPKPSTDKFWLFLHSLFIDWPAMLPKINFKGVLGLPVNVPFLTLSQAVVQDVPVGDKKPPSPPAIPPAALLLLVFGLAFCGTTEAQRAYGTLGVMENSLIAAGKTLPDACKAAELDAVKAAKAAGKTREEATAAADAIDARCKTAAKVLQAAHGGVALARDGVRDVAAAVKSPKDIAGWLKFALDGYLDAQPVLAAFNVKLPGVN